MDYKVKLKNIDSSTKVKIASDGMGFALAQLIVNSPRHNFLHIAEDELSAQRLEQQIRFFLNNDHNVEILQFPAWDCLPYDRVSPKAVISAERINTLYQLSRPLANKAVNKKILVIATINAVLQKTVPLSAVKNLGFKIATGEEISIATIADCLINNGFNRSTIASDIGEFAIRGNIVDIITNGSLINNEQIDLIGYRLDFFGDTVETIKIFDPLTQITNNKINKIDFLPAGEINLNSGSIANFRNNYRNLFGIPQEDMMYNAITSGRSYFGMENFLPLFYNQKLDNIFDYLDNPQISVDNKIFDLKTERFKTIEEYYQARVSSVKESKSSGAIYNPLPPESLYLNDAEFKLNLEKNLVVNFLTAEIEQSHSTHNGERLIDLEIKAIPDFASQSRSSSINVFELFKNFLHSELKNHKILLAGFSAGSLARLQRILIDHDIVSQAIESYQDIGDLTKNKVALTILPLNSGFYSSDIIVVGEASLLGEKLNRSVAKKSSDKILSESINLQIGELVVHRYHGIGKFDGLHTITTLDVTNDFLKIIYYGNSVLFVPVEDINLITRYGSDSDLIQLDKLGTGHWQKVRDQVKKKIKIAAEQLIKIAAERRLKKAPVLIADQHEYDEFKARFGFTETDDQLRAIDEIEEDLQKGSPMDRLVCGDVGFGKTEVAMRAAFICAKSTYRPPSFADANSPPLNRGSMASRQKYQVAVVTPTTLLCRQHYHNFLTRFKDTNLKIAQLSRMVSASEAKSIKNDLAQGKIDIIIGTHALLAKTIEFKKLGLLIIDEEQHFGVAQKERLKELKNEVHILTLSATPIPRTLQMSLSGVKELSIISTPPSDRLAVRNYVMPYDSVIIREAILREYQRGGRVFFVVPKIQDINPIYDKLVRQIPEVKIAIAHGQMPAHDLDKIMNDFYDGKFDVLLSTTIIESGIDISSANTIIIHKAESFGLAQLYQLRGRVGRGKIRGYAYLTTQIHNLSEITKKKLQVIQTLDALGVGFSIASHDLDIRGSGNFLGDEQSGHIRETGIELYQSMLKDAIKDLNRQQQNINAQDRNPAGPGSLVLGATSSRQQTRGVDNAATQEAEADNDYVIQIKLGISLLIPEDYINDLNTRIQFYKRIAATISSEEQEQIRIEIIDRFGPMPSQVENLLQVAYLKNLCKKSHIEKIEATVDGILISFHNNHFDQSEKLLALIFGSKNQIKLQGSKVLFRQNSPQNSANRITNAFKVVNQINNLLK